MIYDIPSHSCGKVEKYSEKDQRTEAADTMHNIIIPSGRVENRQLENQSLVAISQLLAQKKGSVRSRSVEQRKSVCVVCGYLDTFSHMYPGKMSFFRT